jgi:hypothetical protein
MYGRGGDVATLSGLGKKDQGIPLRRAGEGNNRTIVLRKKSGGK